MTSFGSYPVGAAVLFIKKWEGYRDKAYLCPAGVWTIGYGHTAGVKEGDVITDSEADQLLIADIEATKNELARFINVPVSEGMFIALTSLAFNLGAANVPRKCPRLMRALNARDYEAAAKEFLDVTGGGPGLVGRRRQEAALFMAD